MNRARELLEMHGQHDVRNLNLGDSYGPLEAASGHRRRDIVINQARPIRSHIQSHFLGGLIMPDNLLMLEHGWGRGWYRMQHPFTTQHIITYGLLHHPHNALSLHDIEEIYSIIIIGMADPPTYSLVSEHFQPNVNVLQVNALNLYYDTHLTHVRFRNGNDELTLFVRSHDLYIVGFEVNDGTAYLLHHDLDLFLEPILHVGDFVLVLGGLPLHYLQREWMIQVDRIKFPHDLMNRARGSLEMHGQHDVRNLNLGDSYGSLEADSGHRRRDIVINQVGLFETFQGPIRSDIQSHFLGGLIMFDNMLMLEHGWEKGSYRLEHPFATQHILMYGLLHHIHNASSLHDMEEIYSIIIRDMADPPDYRPS
ncbi:hypothetical protein POM88_016011 [Heracleum sosnowskyi]|uniref:rRNA N-glycosylase n=1 Tax=Heracleum sosnowskyi TaxID=360622 RepID=A0AAD8IMH0_9APIA|nr:hypothetical protein POM88_016011 [Heracleum sosnowskyi]